VCLQPFAYAGRGNPLLAREGNLVCSCRLGRDQDCQILSPGVAVDQFSNDAEAEIRDCLLPSGQFVNCHEKPPEFGIRMSLASLRESGERPGYVEFSRPRSGIGTGGWKRGRRRPRSRPDPVHTGWQQVELSSHFPSRQPHRPPRRAQRTRASWVCSSGISPSSSACSARNSARSASAPEYRGRRRGSALRRSVG